MDRQAGGTAADTRWIWFTRRAMWMHLTLALLVPTFLGLFWWQVQRVGEGNTLSWAYVFEWPIFTGYAIYMWWKLVHDQLDAQTGAPVLRFYGWTEPAATFGYFQKYVDVAATTICGHSSAGRPAAASCRMMRTGLTARFSARPRMAFTQGRRKLPVHP